MTGTELIDRTLEGLDDGAAGGFYTRAQALSKINEGLRLFSLLTLCVERRGFLTLEAAEPYYRAQSEFTDFLVPLRVERHAAGQSDALWGRPEWDTALFDAAAQPGAITRVKPARMQDLDALSDTWQLDRGPVERYVALGWSLLVFHPVPASAGTLVSVTYAAVARAVADTADSTPEIPAEYHQDLAAYAIDALRTIEGGELAKGTPYFRPALVGQFLAAVKDMAAYVRTRSIAARYDSLPAELRKP